MIEVKRFAGDRREADLDAANRELQEMAGEIVNFRDSTDAEFQKKCREAEIYFAEQGIYEKDRVEVVVLANKKFSIQGIITSIYARSPYRPENDFVIQVSNLDQGGNQLTAVDTKMLRLKHVFIKKLS